MDTAHSDLDVVPDDAHDDALSAESASDDGSESPPPSESSPAHPSLPIDDTDPSLPIDDADHTPPHDPAPATSSTEDTPVGDGPKTKKPKPSSSNVAAAGSGAKPKSSKSAAPRASSPSPPPPPARRVLETIRLDIKLGGPDDYEVNVSELAKATGQRQATPVPEPKRDSSDESEGEGEDDGEGDEKEKEKEKEKDGQAAAGAAEATTKKRKKVRVVLQDNVETPSLTTARRQRRHHASEYYDTNDPFIDDSELAQDERTFFAQTKQKGFYVSSGQVALLNKAPQRKPKSKKVNILAPSASVSAALSTATLPLPALSGSGSGSASASAGPSNGSTRVRIKVHDGSADAPIALLSDGEDGGGKLKRKMSETQSVASSAGDGSVKKRRKTVDIQPFHPELEAAIEVLKEAIAKERWDVKGKFPPALKPVLAQVALKAVILGEYDENFFNLMPRLFPYNKFTMTKLIKRTIWRDHTTLLMDRQTSLIEELRVLAEDGFPKAKEEWEKSVTQWEKRQERAKADAAGEPANGVGHSTEGSPVVSDAQVTPSIGPSALESRPTLDDGAEHDDGGAAGKGGKDMHPPAQRYRLTDQMKQIIWQLVCLSNECCRIENEKNQLESSNQIVSDQGVRKTLYQKIVAAFPDGWLSSGQISREVSVMKKKYEKESMEIE